MWLLTLSINYRYSLSYSYCLSTRTTDYTTGFKNSKFICIWADWYDLKEFYILEPRTLDIPNPELEHAIKGNEHLKCLSLKYTKDKTMRSLLIIQSESKEFYTRNWFLCGTR